MSVPSESGKAAAPRIVAVDMGYGHLRAARALADAAGAPLVRGDAAPAAGPFERAAWRSVRGAYDVLLRRASAGFGSGPFRRLLARATALPSEGAPDPRHGLGAARLLHGCIGAGLCGGVLRDLPADTPLVTTFYAHAVAAAERGHRETWCVVTDTDVHRVWVPLRPDLHRVRYCVPSVGIVARLRSYGVAPDDIHVTGFPLPPQRTGGPRLEVLRRECAAREARLLGGGGDGPPPLVAVCIGGSGAQTGAVRHLLRGAATAVRAGKLRLLLVAGVRAGVERRFRRWLVEEGIPPGPGVELLRERDFDAYAAAFHGRLGEVDALWTKPSEMVFFAGLGIPLLLAPPLGGHEERNRAMAIAGGAAMDLPRADALADRVLAGLRDGRLAAAARAGLRAFPADGTWRILDRVAGRNRGGFSES